jgi:hypothetical protein
MAFSEGLSGIPSSVSGVKRTEGESIKDIDGGVNSVSNYVKNTVKNDFKFVRPAQDSRDGNSVQASSQVSPSSSQSSNTGNADIFINDTNSPSFQNMSYELPDGYNEIKLSKTGKGKIDADKSGTYVIKVPPLMFSVINFPFRPDFKTIFPSFVQVEIQDGVVMIAAKRNIPVNVVFYHPEKPSLSLSLVLVPDTHKIPANITASFSEARIPESVREKSKSGVVVDGHRIAQIRKKNQANISQYEMGSAHIQMMKKLNTDLARGYLPDGYELNMISEGPTGVMCGDKRLLGRYVQNMTGELFEIDIFEVKNAGNEYVEFLESKCYRNGVASVQFNPSPLVRPGSKVELIIIHSKTPVDNSDRIKRPTHLGGGR